MDEERLTAVESVAGFLTAPVAGIGASYLFRTSECTPIGLNGVLTEYCITEPNVIAGAIVAGLGWTLCALYAYLVYQARAAKGLAGPF